MTLILVVFVHILLETNNERHYNPIMPSKQRLAFFWSSLSFYFLLFRVTSGESVSLTTHSLLVSRIERQEFFCCFSLLTTQQIIIELNINPKDIAIRKLRYLSLIFYQYLINWRNVSLNFLFILIGINHFLYSYLTSITDNNLTIRLESINHSKNIYS